MEDGKRGRRCRDSGAPTGPQRGAGSSENPGREAGREAESSNSTGVAGSSTATIPPPGLERVGFGRRLWGSNPARGLSFVIATRVCVCVDGRQDW
jgi:hypothetical protein